MTGFKPVCLLDPTKVKTKQAEARPTCATTLALQSPLSCASHLILAAHLPTAFIFAADALKF
jgi:hypothetical protein